MCGIFGYVGVRDEAPRRVLAGLKKLEYRGYDSWGIAARQNGTALPSRLLVEKHVGKIGQAIANPRAVNENETRNTTTATSTIWTGATRTPANGAKIRKIMP